MESIQDLSTDLEVAISKIKDWDWKKVVYILEVVPSLNKHYALEIILKSKHKPQEPITLELIQRILPLTYLVNGSADPELLSQKKNSINESVNILLINELLPYAKLNGEHFEEIILWFHTPKLQYIVTQAFACNKSNSLDVDSLERILPLIEDKTTRSEAGVLLLNLILPIDNAVPLLKICVENLNNMDFLQVFNKVYEKGIDMSVEDFVSIRSRLLKDHWVYITKLWTEKTTIKISDTELKSILTVCSDDYSQKVLMPLVKDRGLLLFDNVAINNNPIVVDDSELINAMDNLGILAGFSNDPVLNSSHLDGRCFLKLAKNGEKIVVTGTKLYGDMKTITKEY